MKWTDKFPSFSKHRGKLPADVIAVDAQYVEWAERVGWMKIPARLKASVRKKAEGEHCEWMRERCGNEQCVET